jgi:ketosteroid isomerase-like protein
MFLTDIPKPLKAFLKATEAHDAKALLATFTKDAVLTDMGEDRSGDAIREWNEKFYLGCNVEVHPIHIEQRGGHTVLAVAVDGDYAGFGITEAFQLDWHVQLKGEHIAAIRMVEVKLDLPQPIAQFIKGMNKFDADAMLGSFADDALVNDQQREHAGKTAIRNWADHEIVGDKVTMYVTETVPHAGGVGVLAKVTGEYDKTSLPDPLTLRFYFTVADDKITQLIIIPAKTAAS